jgi:phosphoribosylaminoimidazole (AIR) synthetase
VLVVAAPDVDTAIARLREQGESAVVMGEIQRGSGAASVTIDT